MESRLIFPLMFLGSLLQGFALAFIFKKKMVILISALVPWVAFLFLNLYSDHNSPDRELLQGTFRFFQTTLGTLVTLVGLASCYFAQRLIKGRSNKPLNTDAAKDGASIS